MAKKPKKIAVVMCNGGSHAKRNPDFDPTGLDCVTALEKYPDGNSECKWGCLGLGTCISACKFGALFLNEAGVAQVDPAKCIGCGLCAKKCPRSLITMVLPENTISVRCNNRQPGAAARSICTVSCIACSLCVKNCPADAIHVIDNCAFIDQAKCMACGMCAVKCPRNTIHDSDGIF